MKSEYTYPVGTIRQNDVVMMQCDVTVALMSLRRHVPAGWYSARQNTTAVKERAKVINHITSKQRAVFETTSYALMKSYAYEFMLMKT